MTATGHLLATFRGLDLRVKSRLADERSPRKLGLAALSLAHDEATIERISIADLHEALEEADVSVKKTSLTKALAGAGTLVNRKVVDGETMYRLTIPGRRVAEEVLGAGHLQVMYIDGDKPRTARRELGEILGAVSGVVRICDPYYGVRSLETLELLPTTSDVRFLTAKTTESASKLAGPLKDFKKEGTNIVIRIAKEPKDLHDRFVLSDDAISLVGHGLKDIGDKESFVVVIPRTLAPDLLDDVKRSFDEKWMEASTL